jgi:RNA polymerase sigma-70 factor (ECF subfamily)
MTLSELQQLQAGLSEADGTLQMDPESFRSLYERTARPLWVYLWKKTGDSQLADDLLQETYYRFLRTRVAFETERHQKNYLFRIATNLAFDISRRRRNYKQISTEDEVAACLAPANVAEQSEHRTDLARAMAQLNPRQRDALWLAYAEGSSHEEIASALGLKVNSVKLILFRARRKLADLLRGGKR